MGNYENAGAGIKKMWIASLGSLICVVVMIIPVIGILAAIAALVFMVMSMIGLNQAGKDIDGCRTAFGLTIVNIILSVIGALFESGVMHVIIQIAGYVVSFMVTYLVCTSVGDVMNRIGDVEAAHSGEIAWKINAVCSVLLVLIVIVMMLPVFGIFAGMTGALIALIPSLLSEVFYMLFLGTSNHALNG